MASLRDSPPAPWIETPALPARHDEHRGGVVADAHDDLVRRVAALEGSGGDLCALFLRQAREDVHSVDRRTDVRPSRRDRERPRLVLMLPDDGIGEVESRAAERVPGAYANFRVHLQVVGVVLEPVPQLVHDARTPRRYGETPAAADSSRFSSCPAPRPREPRARAPARRRTRGRRGAPARSAVRALRKLRSARVPRRCLGAGAGFLPSCEAGSLSRRAPRPFRTSRRPGSCRRRASSARGAAPGRRTGSPACPAARVR